MDSLNFLLCQIRSENIHSLREAPQWHCFKIYEVYYHLMHPYHDVPILQLSNHRSGNQRI